MKRMPLCIIIICVFVFLGLISSLCVEKTTSSMSESIAEIEQAYEDGDAGKMTVSADALQKCWENFTSIQIFTSDPERALEITASVARISSFAKTLHEDLLSECSAAKSLIESYRNEQQPTILNIL